MFRKLDEQNACDEAQHNAIVKIWTTLFENLASGQDVATCEASFKKGLELVRQVAGIVDALL